MKSELTLGFKDSITVFILQLGLFWLYAYIMLDGMYVTKSISTGLYPNLDLWTANKLQLQLQYGIFNCSFTHMWLQCSLCLPKYISLLTQYWAKHILSKCNTEKFWLRLHKLFFNSLKRAITHSEVKTVDALNQYILDWN